MHFSHFIDRRHIDAADKTHTHRLYPCKFAHIFRMLTYARMVFSKYIKLYRSESLALGIMIRRQPSCRTAELWTNVFIGSRFVFLVRIDIFRILLRSKWNVAWLKIEIAIAFYIENWWMHAISIETKQFASFFVSLTGEWVFRFKPETIELVIFGGEPSCSVFDWATRCGFFASSIVPDSRPWIW